MSNHSEGRWVLVRGARLTIRQFAADWAQLPPTAGRVWLRTLALGWLLSAALMLGLVWLVRGLALDETALLQRIVAATPFSFNAAIWIETPGNSIFMIPAMLAAAIVAIWWGHPLRALSIVAAFCLIDTVILLGWWTWDRARPTLIAGGIAAPGFHSFPSGHVAQTIAVYGLLVRFWIGASRSRLEQLLALLLLALLVVAVGLSRLRLGTHWPSDVLAGALIGGVWLAVILFALHQSEGIRDQGSGVRDQEWVVGSR